MIGEYREQQELQGLLLATKGEDNLLYSFRCPNEKDLERISAVPVVRRNFGRLVTHRRSDEPCIPIPIAEAIGVGLNA